MNNVEHNVKSLTNSSSLIDPPPFRVLKIRCKNVSENIFEEKRGMLLSLQNVFYPTEDQAYPFPKQAFVYTCLQYTVGNIHEQNRWFCILNLVRNFRNTCGSEILLYIRFQKKSVHFYC